MKKHPLSILDYNPNTPQRSCAGTTMPDAWQIADRDSSNIADRRRLLQDLFNRSMVLNLFLILGVLCVLTGCQTTSPDASIDTNLQSLPDPQLLHEGDVLNIAFPGAPNLNTTQQIRRDGKITLQLVGEIDAAGMTPTALEALILRKYDNQLVSREVTVTLQSSAMLVYVTGAVLRPGKVLSDRPMTAIEAVMEAGGFDQRRANLSAVRIIRHEGREMKYFELDLNRILKGKETAPFPLKAMDIIYVPERVFF